MAVTDFTNYLEIPKPRYGTTNYAQPINWGLEIIAKNIYKGPRFEAINIISVDLYPGQCIIIPEESGNIIDADLFYMCPCDPNDLGKMPARGILVTGKAAPTASDSVGFNENGLIVIRGLIEGMELNVGEVFDWSTGGADIYIGSDGKLTTDLPSVSIVQKVGFIMSGKYIYVDFTGGI